MVEPPAFPVEVSPCALLSPFVSHLFSPRDHLEIYIRQNFSLALHNTKTTLGQMADVFWNVPRFFFWYEIIRLV
jgi:hypothetical protein